MRLHERAATSPIVAAYAEHRDAYRAIVTIPDHVSDQDKAAQPYFERLDAARDVVRHLTASAPEEHAARLRIALQGIDQDGADALILHDLQDLLPEEERGTTELTCSDFFQDLVWKTILELEAQAAAIDPHAAWLVERDGLLAFANNLTGEDDEGHHDSVCGEVSRLETLILKTPAATHDGLLAQCLLAVKVNVEGSHITEEYAEAILANAKRVLS